MYLFFSFSFLISIKNIYIKKGRREVSPEYTSSIHQGQNTTQAHKEQKSIKP